MISLVYCSGKKTTPDTIVYRKVKGQNWSLNLQTFLPHIFFQLAYPPSRLFRYASLSIAQPLLNGTHEAAPGVSGDTGKGVVIELLTDSGFVKLLGTALGTYRAFSSVNFRMMHGAPDAGRNTTPANW